MKLMLAGEKHQPEARMVINPWAPAIRMVLGVIEVCKNKKANSKLLKLI